MDLEAAADILYGVSPEEFVEQRSRLVTEARAAKDRESAKLIGQLRRPTRTGWLVNVLARAEPGRITDLLDLGQALADAQQRSSGPDLRRLSNQRRTTVDSLARRALELGRNLGYQAPEAAHQEVAQTLQAALGDPEVADLLRRGRLTQATSYGGFGMGDLTAALAASTLSEPSELDGRRAEAEPSSREAEAARVEAARVEAARVEARAALEAGAAETQRATAEADRLADQVERLRSQLAEAEAAEQTARAAARAARQHLTDLRQATEESDQAAAAAGLGT